MLSVFDSSVRAVGGTYIATLQLGPLQVKLQITAFPLPPGHPWYNENLTVAERLLRCGFRFVEVKYVPPETATPPPAERKRAASSSPATEKKQRV